jgi:hypothetical protein
MRRLVLLLALVPGLACTASWSSLVRYSDQPGPANVSQITAVHQAVLANYFHSSRDTLVIRSDPSDTISSDAPVAMVRSGTSPLPSEWADTLKREVEAALADSGYGRWLSAGELQATALGMDLPTRPRSPVARFPQLRMTIPGFNSDSTIAVVGMSYVCGGLCGWGGTLFLARRPGSAWRVWRFRRAWVS